MRKGEISIQFNWIFVLIVGALIISFFVYFIYKQKEVSKLQMDADIRTKLQAILTTGQQSSSTIYTIKMPKTELKFDCDGFAIGSLDPIRFRPSFSSSPLKSEKLFIISTEFSMPYKAANLLFLTTPSVRYILHKDFTTDEKLYESIFEDKRNPSLPDNITKEKISNCNGLVSQNHDKVRFVFFIKDTNDLSAYKTCATPFSKLKNDDVTAIAIRPIKDGIKGYGEVYFFKKKGAEFDFPSPLDKARSYYMGIPTILAAIFSDNKETYDCGIKDLLKKMEIVTTVYQEKVDAIKNENTVSMLCRSYLNEPVIDLSVMLDYSKKGIISGTNFKIIYETSIKIKDDNKLLALKSCPLIY